MILPTLKEENWLVLYATIEGISNILYNMDRRTRLKSKMQFSVEELTSFYSEFETEFTLFFVEMEEFVKGKLKGMD
jgi:acyl carrier protein phosphodiesterase